MKKSIACVLLSAMVAFGSFAAGCGGNSQQAEKKTFTIAYAPNESTTDSTDARSTLAKDLGKVINMDVNRQAIIPPLLKHCAPARPIWHIWALWQLPWAQNVQA